MLLTARPLIISGPCSAETEAQVLATAVSLRNTGWVNVLRAGIWKPRTRPGSFEGVGSIGLSWMVKAKELTGLPLAVEVATAKQVEEALKAGIDILWIGARTTVNPFSVQDVADALKGAGVPVLIKNPLNADIELWMGALERVEKAGIKQIGLVHRGFSSYGNTEYRNAPMWHLAIEMKRRNPTLPFLNDPSHITGNRLLLQSISQKAIDLGYDGLMIESHIDPDNAWSDSRQQVTPGRMLEILENITWRSETPQQNISATDLENLREQIDQIDDELFQLLSRRMKVADEIGVYKKQNNITILQTKRWNQMLKRALNKEQTLQLSKEFITRYFEAVHLESINHQTKVMNNE